MKGKNFASSLLIEPNYGYYNGDGSIQVPDFKEVISQLLFSANIFGNQRGKTVFSMFVFYLLTFVFFTVFITKYLAVSSTIYFVFVSLFMAHIYHSHCSVTIIWRQSTRLPCEYCGRSASSLWVSRPGICFEKRARMWMTKLVGFALMKNS